MNKFKNILNDLTNGWAFLYTAIYGMVAFVLGVYTTTINIFTKGLNGDILTTTLFCSACLYLFISIISLPIFIYTQIHKKIHVTLKIILLLALIMFFIFLGKHAFHFEPGTAIFMVVYMIFGVPFFILLYAIPSLILLILDLKHKIKTPMWNIKNKKYLIFFVFYTAICFVILIYIFILSSTSTSIT